MEEIIKNGGARKKRSSMSSQKTQKLIFYCSMIVLPILQFLVFYVYVNTKSFTLGFQEYSYGTGEYTFAGFKNFKQIFADFKSKQYLSSTMWNSIELFFWLMIFGSFVAVFFSYYIFKKHPGSMLFKIFLYLPQMLGGVVVVIMYKFFVDMAVPEIGSLLGMEIKGLLTNLETRRFTIIFFTIYTSFGSQVLVYSSAMSGISDSIIESAQLDGITPMKELIYIVLPSIWNTFVTFMVSSVVGIFSHQMSLYTFYGEKAEQSLYTFGYYLYKETVSAGYFEFPYLSAMGLLLTFVAVPLTLFTRWALKKFGPSSN